MIDCATMRDRMPEIAHRADAWTTAEATHLAICAECATDWRIVGAGVELRSGAVVDADRIANLVIARLGVVAADRSLVRRLPWRGGLIGLLAAAASVVLFISAPRLQRPVAGIVGDSVAALAILPELQGLDVTQLESVLQSLGPAAADATPGVLPHLEDLTDSELEMLLHVQGAN